MASASTPVAAWLHWWTYPPLKSFKMIFTVILNSFALMWWKDLDHWQTKQRGICFFVEQSDQVQGKQVEFPLKHTLITHTVCYSPVMLLPLVAMKWFGGVNPVSPTVVCVLTQQRVHVLLSRPFAPSVQRCRLHAAPFGSASFQYCSCGKTKNTSLTLGGRMCCFCPSTHALHILRVK